MCCRVWGRASLGSVRLFPPRKYEQRVYGCRRSYFTGTYSTAVLFSSRRVWPGSRGERTELDGFVWEL